MEQGSVVEATAWVVALRNTLAWPLPPGMGRLRRCVEWVVGECCILVALRLLPRHLYLRLCLRSRMSPDNGASSQRMSKTSQQTHGQREAGCYCTGVL